MTNALIAKVSIMLLQDCGRRFPSMGGLQSLRAPQRREILTATSPVIAEAQKRMSVRQDGSGNPEAAITLDYNPMRQEAGGVVRTSRAVVGGAATTDPISVTTGFSLHREYTKNFTTYDMIKLGEETERYLKQVNAGQVTFDLDNFPELAIIGDQIMTTIEGLLTPMNSQAIAGYVTAVGRNLVTGDSLSPTLSLYNSDGTLTTELFDFLGSTKRAHNYPGRYVVVGGNYAANYMERRGIVAVNSLGLNQPAMMNAYDFDFFFDPEIDTTMGMNEIIISEANSGCFQTIMEHQYMIKQKSMANTTYGKMSINLAQYNAATFSLDMDLRVKENDTAWPTLDVTPSIHGGLFWRPAGYHKNYGGWEYVTGIYRAKLA